MALTPLPAVLIEPLVRNALLEDLGRAGDITVDAVLPPGMQTEMSFVARQPGAIAGLDLAAMAFRLMDPTLALETARPDGSMVGPGEVIATVRGSAHAILAAERTALNFLCHLSGIATATARMVAAVKGHRARIACTRKTTPGLRAVEKYAVRAGGGSNHRFGLDDAILIKDNHIAVAGGIGPAVARAREHAGHMVKIEVEVDTLAQLEEALAHRIDAVLLDNMTPPQLAEAVRLVAGRALTEASGGVTLASVAAIAATGVDLISAGWITHSAPVLDIGLDHRA